ncbi:MAG: helix-turn-helix domain-containing protein [Planctomycetota bacterium]|jgi:hypothetical protein
MRLENRQRQSDGSKEKTVLIKEPLLTPNDASIILKVTSEQVRNLIRRGQISAINVGSDKKRPLYRITPRALNDFLSSRYKSGPERQNKKFRQLDPVRDFFSDLK